MSEHTPENKFRWRAECVGGDEWVVTDNGEQRSNEITYVMDGPAAHLIAAAPALLEALNSADQWFESIRPEDHPPLHLHEQIRAAIAIAKSPREGD